VNDITDMRRFVDSMPPDHNEAHLALIDALRDYIRAEVALARDLLEEKQITFDEVLAGNASLQPMRDMLRELEAYEMDPTLHGSVWPS
jgi:hypothetical protein